MKRLHQFAWSLLTVLVLWGILTWPLPRFAREGIAYAAHAPADDQPRAMVPGDHLQLLYHFWLFRDMLSGGTPWMVNLYEFNTGSDAERHRPGAYFAPFSWIYAAGDVAAGRAIGWHLAFIGSLAIAFWATWRLARRYAGREDVAWAVALMMTAFPYRWHALLSGSPTGFGMAWTPLLLLGLDVAIRDRSWRGGWLAAVAMIFSAWAEKHCLFFNALLLPVWGGVLLLGLQPWRRAIDSQTRAAPGGLAPPEPKFASLPRSNATFAPATQGRGGRTALRAILCASPAAFGLLLAYGYAALYTRHLGESSMAAGRTMKEVAGFSPHLAGFVDRSLADVSSQIFLGWVLPLIVLAAAAWGFGAAFLRREPGARRIGWTLVFTIALTAVILLLATGPHGGTLGRALFEAARDAISPYRMIRQSAKIMLVLPALLAPLLAFGLARLPRAGIVSVGAALLVGIDMAAWIHPRIGSLDAGHPAYAAIARDAAQNDVACRALAIPLWPGDSHQSSVYLDYATRYRIRMANGYSPVVSRAYRDDFFARHQPANQGVLTDAQIDDLLARGIRWLLLHEDQFPEKVSPFPVAVTLDRLHRNPRVELLQQSGSVWAFRLLDTPRDQTGTGIPSLHLPARLWEAESAHRRGGRRIEDETASGGQAVELQASGDKVEFSLPRLGCDPAVAWWVRLRGVGELSATTYAGNGTSGSSTQQIGSAEWTWIAVPASSPMPFGSAGLALRGLSGSVAIDRALLAGSEWPLEIPPGWSTNLPASPLFHAGETMPDRIAVRMRPRYEPAQVVLYGPRMPLPAGEYEIELQVHTDVEAGQILGEFFVATRERDPAAVSTTVRAGERTRVRWRHPAHDLLYCAYRYNRAAEVRIEGLSIRRLEAP